MKILIINPGSTSFKYSLFINGERKAYHEFQKTNQRFTFDDQEIAEKEFQQNFSYLIFILQKEGHINTLGDIHKFGIRVVHGGDLFYAPTLMTPENFKKLKTLTSLAPLHNPPAESVIDQILNHNNQAKIYAVFDTAFHQTIPDWVSTYAIPQQLSEKFHIKKYGFHGIACQSVITQLTAGAGNKKFHSLQKMIICHLGGGASVSAVKNRQSQATSMGFTPLEGLMMITRAGDLDDGVIFYLAEKLEKTNEEVSEILNQDSGIFGITGLKDMRQVIEKAEAGEPRCVLAFQMFCYRILKYIFAYYGHLQGLDALVFSGGIGEGSTYLRKKIMEKLNILSFYLDESKNQETTYRTGIISAENSKPIFVVHTEEDREIWRQIKSIE